jgi:hypothetical protein
MGVGETGTFGSSVGAGPPPLAGEDVDVVAACECEWVPVEAGAEVVEWVCVAVWVEVSVLVGVEVSVLVGVDVDVDVGVGV